MKIESVENIKTEILSEKIATRRNFPKSIVPKFDDLYTEIVTQIETLVISSECILFDSVDAINENKEYSDITYWTEESTEEEIDSYWLFAQSGQGDFWVFDVNSKVYFHDHDHGYFDKKYAVDLGLDFSKWLQFAYLNKELDELYDTDEVTDTALEEYKSKLAELSTLLLENYPYEI